MNLYPVISLIRHRLLARSSAGHGVHSPFFYDFLTSVIRNKSDVNIVRQVERLRREMLDDRTVISVTDLGAGSLRNKGRERRICDIARWAALPEREAALLARIAGSMEHGAWSKEQGTGRKEYGAQGTEQVSKGSSPGIGIVLELGTSLGISTLALALAMPENRVVTVEGCPRLAETARTNFRRFGAENVEVVNEEFSFALKRLNDNGEKVIFAFVDGNHRGEAMIDYVKTIRSMGEEMIIVVDDIHLSREMYRAWSELKEEAKGITMETGRFGVEFRRKSLTPGEYRIWC